MENEDLLLEILRLQVESTKKANGLQRGSESVTNKKQEKLLKEFAENLGLDFEYLKKGNS